MFLSSTLALITLLQTPAVSQPVNLVKNGSFESGTATPNDWVVGWVGEGKLKITRETVGASKGSAFLRVSTEGARGYGMATQALPSTLRKVRVSGVARRKGSFEESFVSIQTFKGDKQVGYTVAFAPKTEKWEAFSAEIDLPEAERVMLHVSIKGTGTMDVDDLNVVDLAPPGAVKNLVKNGDFESGTTSPDDWSIVWKGEGDPVLRRMTGDAKSGSAFLRIESGGKRAWGLVSQALPAGTRRVKISAWMRISGTMEEALLGLRTSTSANEQKSWTNLINLKETKWTLVTGELDIPEGLAAQIMIVLKGNGTVDVDNLVVTPL